MLKNVLSEPTKQRLVGQGHSIFKMKTYEKMSHRKEESLSICKISYYF